MINHYNLFRSAEIDGSPADGLSSGQGLDNMEKLFKKTMMPGMTFEWTGWRWKRRSPAARRC